MSDRTATVNIEHCKGVLRHAWYPVPNDHPSTLFIVNKCLRCDTVRRMEVDTFGNSLRAWRYEYADKHLYKAISGTSLTEYRAKYIAATMKRSRKQ